MYDLPSEHPEDGMPDVFHLMQPSLVSETFGPPNYEPDEFFTATDLYVYYDLHHTSWHKRPDWFAAVGVPRLYEGKDLRLSYVMWQERVSPTIVVELLSPGTYNEDLGRKARRTSEPPSKWDVYEKILKVPYYVVFDHYTDEHHFFRLTGERYEDMSAPDGRLWIAEFDLGLGLWTGPYRRATRMWLRWYDASGNWIATQEERLDQASEQAAQESERAERLAAKLRALGEDPDRSP